MSQSLKRSQSKRAESRLVIMQAQQPFTITIEIRTKDGLTCRLQAVLDTGCPVDLVSLWFARRYLCERDEEETYEFPGNQREKDNGKRREDKEQEEIVVTKSLEGKLLFSGEWRVPITTTCSQGKRISFTSFCAGIERNAQLPPIVLGMATLESQNFYLAPQLQNWWQSRPPLPLIPVRISENPGCNFDTENAFFDNEEEKMPLHVIFDTGTVKNGVSIDFARKHLSQVKSAPKSNWIDAEGKEHPCDGLWKLPLRLRSLNDQERSFTALCWGMNLGEPSSEGHYSVLLSNATLVEQDILLDCGTWNFYFQEGARKGQQHWVLKLVRFGIEKTKSLCEKIERKLDEE
ncbi:unnamed protein product [Clonostachys rosea]|uniref:Peptidase A2 domain-containing protein n=1 Tax=Bionectria ochroleuca TaxID=29856 RepID=A0ABY6UI18_BIOOC|nr:unnamed protein product [Clonostachys rosea]